MQALIKVILMQLHQVRSQRIRALLRVYDRQKHNRGCFQVTTIWLFIIIADDHIYTIMVKIDNVISVQRHSETLPQYKSKIKYT